MIMTPTQQIVHNCMMGGSPNYAAQFIGKPVGGYSPPMAPELSSFSGIGTTSPFKSDAFSIFTPPKPFTY